MIVENGSLKGRQKEASYHALTRFLPTMQRIPRGCDPVIARVKTHAVQKDIYGAWKAKYMSSTQFNN
jgi:hypothetical protein